MLLCLGNGGIKFAMYLTILIPCLNEEATVAKCVQQALLYIENNNILGEVIVVDNGSTDNTKLVASIAGARVIYEPVKGYGSALRRGIREAKGDYIIMGDGDCSYDFSNLDNFIECFNKGFDFVCGNRFAGGIESGAMSLSHYIGNIVLSKLASIKYNIDIHDFHCGLRGFSTAIAQSLNFKTLGMEFATEMIHLFREYNITEIPVTLSKDKRIGKSHLRTIRDGSRHLRYILFNL